MTTIRRRYAGFFGNARTLRKRLFAGTSSVACSRSVVRCGLVLRGLRGAYL